MQNRTFTRRLPTRFFTVFISFFTAFIAPALTHAAPRNMPVEAFFDTDCDDAVIDLIKASRSEVLIAIYALTKRNIAKALIQASEKGVRVQIRYDDDQARAIDTMQELITTLEKAGIVCHPVHLEKQQAHMHHKFMVVDRKKVLTGSYNFTHQGSTINKENVVIMSSSVLAKEFVEVFKQLNISEPAER